MINATRIVVDLRSLHKYPTRFTGTRRSLDRVVCTSHAYVVHMQRSGTALRDLVSLQRSTFKLGLPRSQQSKSACREKAPLNRTNVLQVGAFSLARETGKPCFSESIAKNRCQGLPNVYT